MTDIRLWFILQEECLNKGDVNLIYSNLYCRTISQLDKWGVKYDQLVMGKIHFDVLVDDKVWNSRNITKKAIENLLDEN